MSNSNDFQLTFYWLLHKASADTKNTQNKKNRHVWTEKKEKKIMRTQMLVVGNDESKCEG